MPFTDGTQAQNEPTAVFGRAGLIGVAHDARIEQGRHFKRILVQKVGADQAALRLVEYGMRRQRLFHLRGARLEDLQQVPVTTFEVLEHIGQLARSGVGLEPKYSADDTIGPGLIRRIEVSGFRRRFEGSDDDPGRIGAQVQGLAVQKLGLRQGCSLGSLARRPRDVRRGVPIWRRA